MTDEKAMPDYDYELVFDPSECGSAAYTYYSLLTDYHSPADILIRWPTRGFSGHEDNAQEKAQALAHEVVRRWNLAATLAQSLEKELAKAKDDVEMHRVTLLENQKVLVILRDACTHEQTRRLLADLMDANTRILSLSGNGGR